MHRNAILNIYLAYNIAGKAFGNVLMSNFYTRNFHVKGDAPNSDRDLGGGAPKSDGGLGGCTEF